MFKRWTPKSSGPSKVCQRRQKRKTAVRFRLCLERCEDRLAAGQILSFLFSPLGDLAASPLDPLRLEREGHSAPPFQPVAHVLSDHVGFAAVPLENEFAREQDERLP